jgi:hypothetical protein
MKPPTHQGASSLAAAARHPASQTEKVWNLTVPVSISRDISTARLATGGAMPDQKLLSLARELRARAQEVLAQAETYQDAQAREEMRGIAAKYEELARRLEMEAGDIDKL